MGCGSSIEAQSSTATENDIKSSANCEVIEDTNELKEKKIVKFKISKDTPDNNNMYSSFRKSIEDTKCNKSNVCAKDERIVRTLSKRMSSFRWQDVELSSLLDNVKLEDEHTHWWDIVDKLCVREQPVVRAETERKGWKTVRLFVSSTFKDMWSEREYLAKRVFPELKQWCETRKLRLVDCDLRWGVPKDADTSQTILTCLSEIDRCKEENGQAYFLNLMSERYGWVPESSVVPDDIKSRYKWLAGMSVTALEIFTAAYWDRNPKALYLMRSPEILNGLKDNDVKAIYEEQDGTHKESLRVLKGKLLEKCREQVKEYDCMLEKIEGTKLHLSGLENFGQIVLDHFKFHIERQYPGDSLGEELSVAEIQRGEHEMFMMQRSEVLLGRDEMISDIKRYLKHDVDRNVPLALVGSAGAGKSALVAYTAKYCTQQPDFKVFYHFVGATSLSTDLYQILARFFMEFMPTQDKMPTSTDDMIRYTPTMIQKAWQSVKENGFKRMVLLIDALNQMDDEIGGAHSLVWLPRLLPEGVRIVVSTLDGKCLEALREHPVRHQETAVEPLGIQVRKLIAENILSDYSKQLDSEQMTILISKKDAGRPLWLTVACEELRVFGEFRKLTQKTEELPEDLPGLLKLVLERIVNEYGGDLVISTLCLIETSRFGLTEAELLELLVIEPVIPTGDMVHSAKVEHDAKLAMAQWALVYLGLKRFLRPCGSFGGGRLDFYHRTISKVVREMYLNHESKRHWWHKRLAKYFSQCHDIERKAEELPYHLECSQDKDGLKSALLEWDMFDELYHENTSPQLMAFWRFIGGYDVAAEEYISRLHNYIQDASAESTKILSVQNRVGWFLVDIGEYDKARYLLEDVLKKVATSPDKLVHEKADALHAIVMLLYRKALQYVYGSNPGYKECRRLGDYFAVECIKIHRQNWPATDNYRGHVLTVCGYFCSEALEEAREIFELTGDKQGLAQVLYMLGEKNQYNRDMNVPISLFSHSALLCMSTFGKFNLHTARCNQLFGQMYWNNTISQQNYPAEWMEKCLELYKTELEILEEILGPLHPTSVRSREDVIIILENLGRNQESTEFQKQQPSQHNAVN